jgi:hypothetical protein
VPRLEAAFDAGRAQGDVGGHRFGESLQRNCAQVLERKEAFGKTVRSRRDHNLPWGGERLQAGGKIRRLAHDAALLRLSRSYEVSNDNQPCRNPNTSLKGDVQLKPLHCCRQL